MCVPADPPVEVCNGRDDDCNGRVDDGLGLGPRSELATLRTIEGDTGDCSSCRWAWSPVLARLADGNYLARWYVGIYGGREQPNIFTRLVSPRGEILGDVVREPRDVLLAQNTLAFSEVANGDTVFGVSFRDGTDDVPGWQTVHPDGSVTSVRAANGTHYRTAQFLRGDRIGGAWGTGDALGFDTSMLDRSSARSVSRALPMSFSVTSGSFGDHTALIAAALEGTNRPMYFLELGADGNASSAPRRIGLPYESYPRLLGISDGYLAIIPGTRDTPARHQRLLRGGDAVGDAVPFEDGRRLSDSGLTDHFMHHPREPMIAAVWQDPNEARTPRMHVETLDESGNVVASWSGDAPGTGGVVSPSITFVDDTILVAWHDVERDNTPNRVYLRAFGCVP